MAQLPIEDHGIIGNMETAALIGVDGSIDFLCQPLFDSPSVFASLLEERAGVFRLAPALPGARNKQLYLPDTNILLTRFLSPEGVAEVADFMAVDGKAGMRLYRRAKCVRGHVAFAMLCQPRFDYARISHTAKGEGNQVIFTPESDQPGLRLLCEQTPMLHELDALASFELSAGETATFLLQDASIPCGDKLSSAELREMSQGAFEETLNYWQSWIGGCTYHGRWREMVHRSALVLKLLTASRYGSLVAAPTFGLPELLGGERNWDYRYTWVRDASLALVSLMRLGYAEEAAGFMHWIEDRCRTVRGGQPLRIAYGIDGREQLPEESLAHFSGYAGSHPVRIGNAAYDQLQLDIYGELLHAVDNYDRCHAVVHHDLWKHLVTIVDWLCKNWRQPDEGIWEVRGGRQEFLFSRVMCWVAIDRGIRIAYRRGLPAPVAAWREVRDQIYKDIYGSFWDERQGAFVQHIGSSALDASCLAMPLVGFIAPNDPRWLRTLSAMKTLVEDSLVHRYNVSQAASDGLSGNEGSFCICSFWYVESLCAAGQLDRARFFFEKMMGYANHLGLYSEELGQQGEHLGNFPQAFTHLALVDTALRLDEALSQRARSGQAKQP
jgi:GH15 family glucan-1,4-alpha-glucosidase